MLGKRFSFVVHKKIIFTEIFNLKWRNVRFFYKLIATTTKKVEVYWLKLINIVYFG